MDNRSFISHLASRTEIDIKECQKLTGSLSLLLAKCLSDNNNIAIPGFGTFNSIKTEEFISTDPETNASVLNPPAIEVHFTPATRIKKAIVKN